MQLAYNSFAENRLSAALVFDFVVYMVLKGREPRFLEVLLLLLLSCPLTLTQLTFHVSYMYESTFSNRSVSVSVRRWRRCSCST